METGSKGRIDTRKENIIYVGIDLHKETHTAVMLDCWNQKLGEITFDNKPSVFHKLTRKVSRFVTKEKTAVYGLKNAYGYGRALAVWLLEKGCAVKDVNTALSYAQRKSVPMYQKNDSYDAEAVALVLINMLDKLPDAVPDDAYWTLGQLVNRRDNICSHQQRLKKQLHEQLCVAYPSYKGFFGDISRATALYFWLTTHRRNICGERQRKNWHQNCAQSAIIIAPSSGQRRYWNWYAQTVRLQGNTKRAGMPSLVALQETWSITGNSLRLWNQR